MILIHSTCIRHAHDRNWRPKHVVYVRKECWNVYSVALVGKL